MAGKNTAAFGIYPSRSTLESGVSALRSAHFRNEDISVLFPENVGTKDIGHEKATKAPEGSTAGGVVGAVTGGVLGWLAGVGAIAIPGIGPFIAAGPIVGALAGVGAGGVAGGIIGALVGIGIPEYEAKRYEGRIRKGGILISVHCDNSEWTRKAKDILEQTGAEDVASTGESGGDFAKATSPYRETTGRQRRTNSIEQPSRQSVSPQFGSLAQVHSHNTPRASESRSN